MEINRVADQPARASPNTTFNMLLIFQRMDKTYIFFTE
jgi:hypothetical protein